MASTQQTPEAPVNLSEKTPQELSDQLSVLRDELATAQSQVVEDGKSEALQSFFDQKNVLLQAVLKEVLNRKDALKEDEKRQFGAQLESLRVLLESVRSRESLASNESLKACYDICVQTRDDINGVLNPADGSEESKAPWYSPARVLAGFGGIFTGAKDMVVGWGKSLASVDWHEKVKGAGLYVKWAGLSLLGWIPGVSSLPPYTLAMQEIADRFPFRQLIKDVRSIVDSMNASPERAGKPAVSVQIDAEKDFTLYRTMKGKFTDIGALVLAAVNRADAMYRADPEKPAPTVITLQSLLANSQTPANAQNSAPAGGSTQSNAAPEAAPQQAGSAPAAGQNAPGQTPASQPAGATAVAANGITAPSGNASVGNGANTPGAAPAAKEVLHKSQLELDLESVPQSDLMLVGGTHKLDGKVVEFKAGGFLNNPSILIDGKKCIVNATPDGGATVYTLGITHFVRTGNTVSVTLLRPDWSETMVSLTSADIADMLRWQYVNKAHDVKGKTYAISIVPEYK